MTGIYKIESRCKPDRVYIGSAMNIKMRWMSHLRELRSGSHKNPKLRGHYEKYGKDDLDFSIIESCSSEKLIEREQFYINELNPSFNICRTAGSMLGHKHSDESRKRISEGHMGQKSWNKGKKMSFEVRKNISEAHKGQTAWNKGQTGIYSEEALDKMRGNKNALGRIVSEETRQKLRYPRSEAQRQVMRGKRYALGYKHTEEFKNKIRGNRFAIGKRSEETKQRMREAALRNGSRPPSRLGTKHSESQISKQRESIKKTLALKRQSQNSI